MDKTLFQQLPKMDVLLAHPAILSAQEELPYHALKEAARTALDSLRRARLLGARRVVGLNSDRSVRALKGPSRPVNPQDLRAELLAALRPVDMVVIFDEDTPRELLSRLRPDVLAKGGDYRAEELPGREFVDEVVILPLLEGHSTTRILNHGREGGAEA